MPCNSKLVGIQLFICENGRMKPYWVDLDQVRALSWCTEKVGEKPDGKGGTGRMPQAAGPRPCPDESGGGGEGGASEEAGYERGGGPAQEERVVAFSTSTNSDGDICWWDGSQWVCGMA